MKRSKKPVGTNTVTVHFDTKEGVKNFIAWYLDGGGEQSSHYHADKWGKDWIHVKAPEEACIMCEHYDEELLNKASNNVKLKRVPVTCWNCNKYYSFANPYYEE